MLRVGLTGEMGSGKSTVARLLAQHGAIILSSDDMGRALMQPGQAVHDAIVERFGAAVVLPDGQLDRPALARLAFSPEHPRVEELNATVHPAVIAEQERRLATLATSQPDAIVVIESALIFTTRHGTDQPGATPWRTRFDTIVLVTAPEAVQVQRYVERVSGGRSPDATALTALQDEARQRLAAQRIPQEYRADCRCICNDGTMSDLQVQVDALWADLQRVAGTHP